MNIGDRVGDYEVVAILGAGGMGQVYKVRNTLSERLEAMKILLPNLEGDAGLGDRFLREIKLQAALDHPNIAKFHTAMRVGNQLVMFMEFVDGTSVAQLLEQGAIPASASVAYTGQVLDALSYAHSRGVVHRDIKPANIMVTPSGAVKLMDFGIARMKADQRLTQAGGSVGSLLYMSPEQIKGVEPDGRADIYSLGITLYEMVTGRRPFAADSDFQLMSAHLLVAPPPPIEIIPGVPLDLNDIILMAIAKEPGQRFQSADAFRGALSSLGMGIPTAPTLEVITHTLIPIPVLKVPPPFPTTTMLTPPSITEPSITEMMRTAPTQVPTTQVPPTQVPPTEQRASQTATLSTAGIPTAGIPTAGIPTEDIPTANIPISTQTPVQGAGGPPPLPGFSPTPGFSGQNQPIRTQPILTPPIQTQTPAQAPLPQMNSPYGNPAQAFPPPQAFPAQAGAKPPSRRGLYMALGSVVTLAVLIAAVLEGPKLIRGGSSGAATTSVTPPATSPAEPSTPVSTTASTPTPEPAAPEPATTAAAPTSGQSGSSSVGQSGNQTPSASQESAAVGRILRPRMGQVARGEREYRAQNLTPTNLVAPGLAPAQSQTYQAQAVPNQAVPEPQNQAVPNQAPQMNPMQVAEMKELRRKFNEISIRATTARSALNVLEQRQAQMGVSLRGDIHAARTRMDVQLQEAMQAIRSGDVETAKESLQYAEGSVVKIEKFMGQ